LQMVCCDGGESACMDEFYRLVEYSDCDYLCELSVCVCVCTHANLYPFNERQIALMLKLKTVG